MKILLLGKNGQVGWELQRSLAALGKLSALDSSQCNLSDLSGLGEALARHAPDVIVNAAAYTAVDGAESEPELAYCVNAEAPRVMAEFAARTDALMVHYSTDYVFSGLGHLPWRESDETGPMNVYGHSKLAGERAIQATRCRHLIFRTCWVYAARGNNFAKTMLRMARQQETLGVIADQFGAPTSAELIADVTAHAVVAALREPGLTGLYHLAAEGETSWYDYACYVLTQAANAGVDLKVRADAVQALTTDAYPTVAKRPANSRLDTLKLQTAFALSLPTWRRGVARMLTELIEKQS